MMTDCKLSIVKVDEKDPYKNDLLSRKTSGLLLQKLIEELNGGFVLAINGKWGSGKSTFIDMWKKQMENENYTVLSYNAWETDYMDDPLIGLIAEFKKKTDVVGQEKIKKFTEAVGKISLSMVPPLIAMMVKHLTGVDIEDLSKAIEKGTEKATEKAMDLLNQSVDKYNEQQQSIKAFRESLQEYVLDISPDKPVIFIIDELDRCKPDFAVKTLERIKHLFTVENVVFVLAIDREQLGHSIRGYYGSDLINADDYLRKFFDLQYNLPATIKDVDSIVDSVLKRFDFANSAVLKSTGGDMALLDALKNFVSSLFHSKDLSIRQLEKWMIHTRLIIDQAHNLGIYPHTLAFIVYLRHFDIDFFDHLMNYNISDQDTLDRLTNYFKHASFQKGVLQGNVALIVIAEILKMRYCDDPETFHSRIFDDKKDILLLNMDPDFDSREFCNVLKVIDKKTVPPMFYILQLT